MLFIVGGDVGSPASAFLHEIQSNRRWTDNHDNSGDMLTPGHFLGI
jgi:hypothetical protein